MLRAELVEAAAARLTPLSPEENDVSEQEKLKLIEALNAIRNKAAQGEDGATDKWDADIFKKIISLATKQIDKLKR